MPSREKAQKQSSEQSQKLTHTRTQKQIKTYIYDTINNSACIIYDWADFECVCVCVSEL